MSEEAPLVSVIVPAFGRVEYLRQLLSSAMRSSALGLEVIIVDDGSAVPIAAALGTDFDGRGVQVIRQRNAGTAAARNAGAALARGRFLLFIDDDDVIPSGSLEWRAAHLQTYASIVAVGGRCEFLRAGQRAELEPVRWRGALSRWDLLVHNRFYSPGQVLIRRSDFERTNGFPIDRTGSDDWALWIDLARFGPIHMDARVGLGYRLHDGNFSRNVATMSRGAAAVIDDTIPTLCTSHAAIGAYLASVFVRDVYAPKLRDAARDAEAAQDTAALLEIGKAARRLRDRLFAATIAQKVCLAAHHGRLRMTPDELEHLGRDCQRCAARAGYHLETAMKGVPASVVA